MRSFSKKFKTSNVDEEVDSERKQHADFKLNEQAGYWFVEFWQPKAGDKAEFQVIGDYLSISWEENHGRSIPKFVQCVRFDMPHSSFRSQVTYWLEKIGVFVRKSKTQPLPTYW
ncbi:MAG: hypothetical protein V4708_16900 [Bacteroidota bacterium]